MTLSLFHSFHFCPIQENFSETTSKNERQLVLCGLEEIVNETAGYIYVICDNKMGFMQTHTLTAILS